MTQVERDFARYVRRGDVQALGRVYDACAEELLGLAIRLVGDPVVAEDLLQATMVAAIEAASTFDLRRPVMPWLVGILNHRVRRWRRDRVPREFEFRATEEPDPHLQLERRELEEHVTRALARVAEPYRAVLILSLRHGMEPADIAFALQRTPSTVRSQLLRGKQLLRDRLPAHLALPAIAALPSTQGLLAVREAVVAHGTAHGVVHSTTTLGMVGWTMANTTNWSLLGAVVLMGVLGLSAAGGERAPEVGIDSTSSVTRNGSSPMKGTGRVEFSTPETELRRLRLNSVEAKETGKPGAPTAELIVEVFHGNHRVQNVPISIQHAYDSESAVRRTVTDSRGVARFPHSFVGGLWVRTAAGGMPTEVTTKHGQTARVKIQVRKPGWVRGLVVEEAGGAVAGAQIWLDRHGPIYEAHDVVHTDEAGRFLLPCWHGSHVGARASGRQPVVRDVHPKAGSTIDVVLRLPSDGANLRGLVVAGPQNLPVADAVVEIGRNDLAQGAFRRADGSCLSLTMTRHRTDAVGAFSLQGLAPGSVPILVTAPGWATHQARIEAMPGQSHRIVVTLRRGVTVRGVIKNADGKPAAGIRVVVGTEISAESQRDARTGKDGSYVLHNVPAKPVYLTAMDWRTVQAREVLDLTAGKPANWSPVLNADYQFLVGTLRSASGKKLPGWTVSHRAHAVLPPRVAVVDEDGTFRFAVRERDRETTWNLTVHAPTEGTVKAHDRQAIFSKPVTAGSGRVEINLPQSARPSARLRVKVEDLPKRLSSVLTLVGPTGSISRPKRTPDGTLNLGPLVPGRYELFLWSSGQGVRLGSWNLRAEEVRDAGSVKTLRPGVLEVDLRLPEASHSGSAFRGARLEVRDADTDRYYSSWSLSSMRRFHCAPGRYRVRLMGCPLEPLTEIVDVKANEVTKLHWVPRAGALRQFTFVRSPSVKPMGELVLNVRDVRSGNVIWARRLTGNKDHWSTQLNLVPGTYRIEAKPREGKTVTRVVRIDSLALKPRVFLVKVD